MLGRSKTGWDVLKQDWTFLNRIRLSNSRSIWKSSISFLFSLFLGSVKQDFQLSNRLEEKVINDCMDVINQNRKNIELSYKIENLQRTFGATLSYYISLKHQEQGIFKVFVQLNLLKWLKFPSK